MGGKESLQSLLAAALVIRSHNAGRPCLFQKKMCDSEGKRMTRETQGIRKEPLFYYGWIVVAIAFAANALADGGRNAFSVFYVEILADFGWGRASTAIVFSLNMLVYGISAPFAGGLVDRFGPRKVVLVGAALLTSGTILCSRATSLYHFYFLFGVVNALGTALVGFPAHAAILPLWFKRKRATAFGIVISGWGLSFFTIVPCAQYLVSRFGWRTSFVLFGAVIGGILFTLMAIFCRHKPEDLGLFPDGRTSAARTERERDLETQVVNRKSVRADWTLRKAFRSYRFWLILLITFLALGFTENFVIVHKVALMRDAGFSPASAVSVVALWGMMFVVGCLASSISDRIGRETALTISCSLSILGLSMLLLVENMGLGWAAYCYAVLFGLGLGISGPVITASLAEMFEGNHFGAINGSMILALGLGGFVGPWFGGLMFDRIGSYSLAVIASMAVTAVSCILLWVAAPRRARVLAEAGY